jgi:hypothetical protein
VRPSAVPATEPASTSRIEPPSAGRTQDTSTDRVQETPAVATAGATPAPPPAFEPSVSLPASAPAVTPAVTAASLPGSVPTDEQPDTSPAARVLGSDTTPAAARASSAVAVPVVPDEEQVRRTLQRYQSAYESLDAQSARAIWPRVDGAALQRAFDGLESQRLTFSDCQVQVRGSYGSAVCRGTTRYVPKVGSHEPRVEPRTWTFALRKSGDEWQIDSARAER